MYRVDNILKNEAFKGLMAQIAVNERTRKFCCHGLDHSLDVARIGWIISLEDGMDIPKYKIYAAALLHDLGRASTEPGVSHHIKSVEYCEGILRDCGFNEDDAAEIKTAIGAHNTDGKSLGGLAEVLYRADKLSRMCFDCDATTDCYWPGEQKNKGVIY